MWQRACINSTHTSALSSILQYCLTQIWHLSAARLVGHLVPSGCYRRRCSGAASKVVFFTDDGDGPILRPDSSHDVPDALCKHSKTGKSQETLSFGNLGHAYSFQSHACCESMCINETLAHELLGTPLRLLAWHAFHCSFTSSKTHAAPCLHVSLCEITDNRSDKSTYELCMCPADGFHKYGVLRYAVTAESGAAKCSDEPASPSATAGGHSQWDHQRLEQRCLASSSGECTLLLC